MNIRRGAAVMVAAALALAACGGETAETPAETAAETTTTTAESTTTTAAAEEADDEASDDDASDNGYGTGDASAYPLEIEGTDGRTVTIAARPERIVSMSPSATEMLFAVGAGGQVVAADSFSNFPAEAPTTDLSAFEPNFEAIAAFEPDLVITSFDPESALAGAFAPLDVPVLVQGSASTIEDTYAQIANIGVVTDYVDGAAAVNADIRKRVDAAIATAAEGDGVRVYHELDDTFFSVSSSSFIGDLYAKMGFENVADPADPDGFGFPQVTPEFLIEADPELIVITDQVGYTPEDVIARPGWDVITAVKNENVVSLDADVASRWGPRVADLAERMAELAVPVTSG